MMYWKFKKTQKEEDKYVIKILNAKARDGNTGRIYMQLFPELYLFGANITEQDYNKNVR